MLRSYVPFFARRGYTSHGGKLGAPMGQLRLTDRTETLVRAAAAKAGLPVAEFVRELVEVAFQGRSEIERRHAIRLDAIEPYAVRVNEKIPTSNS